MLAFALSCSALAAADDLASIRELIGSGDTERAVTSFLAWVEEHPDDPQLPETVLEVVPHITSLEERRRALESALRTVTDPKREHEILVLLAGTCELLGDVFEAQGYYLDAAFARIGEKDLGSLLRSALLSLELGEYRNAEAQARVIHETGKDPLLTERARVVLSRIYYATDRSVAAFALLMDGEEIRDDIGAEGLYWLSRMAQLSEDLDISEQAKLRLAEEYPDTLERSLVVGSAERLPTPSAILEAVATDTAGSTPEPPVDSAAEAAEAGQVSADEPTALVAVQTGSFAVRENAEYAAKDLRSEGFAAEILPRVVESTTYYRVVVPDVPLDELPRTVLELKEAGFEGFPIYGLPMYD